MSRPKAFTLVEVLVAVAIIALLVAILLPSLYRAQELANRTACSAHQRKIAEAILAYAEEYDGYGPCCRTYGARDPALPGWHWALGPYLGVRYWDPGTDGAEDQEEQKWQEQRAVFYRHFGCPSWQDCPVSRMYRNQSLGVNQHLLMGHPVGAPADGDWSRERRILHKLSPPSEWVLVLDNYKSYVADDGANANSPPSTMCKLAYGWQDPSTGGSLVPRHWKEGLNLTMLDQSCRFHHFEPGEAEPLEGRFTTASWHLKMP